MKSATSRNHSPYLLEADFGVCLETRRPTAEDFLLHPVQFNIAPGEKVAIIGRSGSGKSLTAKACAGVLPPTLRRTGTLHAPAKVALVGQRSTEALNPLVRVGKQLALTGTDPGPLLRSLGLEPVEKYLAAFPGQLSGGQCQRVAIALALLSRPDLLIADECTTALDPLSQQLVLGALSQAETLLLITHELAVAAELCERLIVIDSGRLYADLPLASVLPGAERGPDLGSQDLLLREFLVEAYDA